METNDLLLIDRIDPQDDATRSNVYISGKISPYKLIEDVIRAIGQKVHGKTAVWAGRYLLGLRQSPRFSKEYYTRDDINLIPRKDWEKLSASARDDYHPHDLIWVRNVQDFEYILFHWGNTAFDTDGCGVVGSSFGKIGINTAVLNSRDAYVKFYAQIAPEVRKGGRYVTYRNPAPGKVKR